MGTTIGINTMMLFASVFYLLHKEYPGAAVSGRKLASAGILVSNIALLLFWISLLGGGMIKISGKLNNESFQEIMKRSEPYFKAFTFSGLFILLGLVLLVGGAVRIILTAKAMTNQEKYICNEKQ